jgi:hypothetical protein
VTLERGLQALVANRTASANSLGELFAFKSILFALGGVR